MTYNGVTKTISVRIEHGALRVLEWKAHHDGVPLRSAIRNYLQRQAEEITQQFGLVIHDDDVALIRDTPPADIDPDELAQLEAEGAFAEIDEFEAEQEDLTNNPTQESE